MNIHEAIKQKLYDNASKVDGAEDCLYCHGTGREVTKRNDGMMVSTDCPNMTGGVHKSSLAALLEADATAMKQALDKHISDNIKQMLIDSDKKLLEGVEKSYKQGMDMGRVESFSVSTVKKPAEVDHYPLGITKQLRDWKSAPSSAYAKVASVSDATLPESGVKGAMASLAQVQDRLLPGTVFPSERKMTAAETKSVSAMQDTLRRLHKAIKTHVKLFPNRSTFTLEGMKVTLDLGPQNKSYQVTFVEDESE